MQIYASYGFDINSFAIVVIFFLIGFVVFVASACFLMYAILRCLNFFRPFEEEPGRDAERDATPKREPSPRSREICDGLVAVGAGVWIVSLYFLLVSVQDYILGPLRGYRCLMAVGSIPFPLIALFSGFYPAFLSASLFARFSPFASIRLAFFGEKSSTRRYILTMLILFLVVVGPSSALAFSLLTSYAAVDESRGIVISKPFWTHSRHYNFAQVRSILRLKQVVSSWSRPEPRKYQYVFDDGMTLSTPIWGPVPEHFSYDFLATIVSEQSHRAIVDQK